MNAHLPAVLLLLENMTLSEDEAAQVHSVIHVAADPSSTSVAPNIGPVSLTTPVAEFPLAEPNDTNLDVDSDITSEAVAVSPDVADPSVAAETVAATPPTPADPLANPAAAIPTPIAQAILLQHLRDLPVTPVHVDDHIRFQKTYNGFTFDVPPANAASPFYLVTRGHRVGVFSTWQRTAPHVLGVSLASHSRVASMDAGLLGMAEAINSNEVNVVV